MTAPGPAQPAPGTPASPAPGAPGAPTPAGGQANPPVPTPPQPTPPQPAPQQPAPQQAAPQLPAAKQPAALPAAAAPAGLPVPAAQAAPPVPVVQTAAAAPASPPPTKTTKKTKATSGGGGGGYLVAVFALIISVIAAGGAAYSLKLSMDLRDENSATPLAEATPSPDGSVAQEPEPTQTQTPTPTATTPAGPEYDPELVRLEVRVPNPTGCTAAYVDVDTANVGVDNGHEFYLSRCQNPSALQVHIDRTSGRSTSDDDPSAEECAALVAGTPTTELVLQAAAGLTFCLLTNRTQANAANLPQRLAIVEVLSVTTTEVRLALSTFSIED